MKLSVMITVKMNMWEFNICKHWHMIKCWLTALRNKNLWFLIKDWILRFSNRKFSVLTYVRGIVISKFNALNEINDYFIIQSVLTHYNRLNVPNNSVSFVFYYIYCLLCGADKGPKWNFSASKVFHHSSNTVLWFCVQLKSH